MPEYVRATDLDTGHKVTIFRSELDHGNYRELKADALNSNGDPLPVEVKESAPKPVAAPRKRTAKKTPTKPLSSSNEGQQATDTTEEK